MNEGTWFYFDVFHHDSGGICLRTPSPEAMQKIQMHPSWALGYRQKYSWWDRIFNRKLIQRRRKAEHEAQVQIEKMMWDYCIVDWKDVQLDGNDAECYSSNKERLMRCPDFARFVAGCIEKLTKTN